MYGAREARELTGVSVAQLNHWRYMGLIWPLEPAGGSGYPARFDDDDIEWLKTIKALTDLGVEPGRILQAARTEGVQPWASALRAAALKAASSYPVWLDTLTDVESQP